MIGKQGTTKQCLNTLLCFFKPLSRNSTLIWESRHGQKLVSIVIKPRFLGGFKLGLTKYTFWRSLLKRNTYLIWNTLREKNPLWKKLMFLWAIKFVVHISLTDHLLDRVKMIAAFPNCPPRGIKRNLVFKTPL